MINIQLTNDVQPYLNWDHTVCSWMPYLLTILIFPCVDFSFCCITIFGKVFLLYRTFDCFKDKLSTTTVIFIRSENNLALLQLYVLLGISEHMLWIQSMFRVTCDHEGITIGWNFWFKPLLCMCGGCWVESIWRPGVVKRTLSQKWLRWDRVLFNTPGLQIDSTQHPPHIYNNGLTQKFQPIVIPPWPQVTLSMPWNQSMCSEMPSNTYNCSNARLFSDLMKITVVTESLSLKQSNVLSKRKTFPKYSNTTEWEIYTRKFKYGIGAQQLLPLWQKYSLKECEYKNHRIFTVRCIDKGIIPVSVRLKSEGSK